MRGPQRADSIDGTVRGTAGIALVAALSLMYGLIHAALPGHRKVLLVSYFASVDAPVRHAIVAGISVAALHSGAAAVVTNVREAFALRGGHLHAHDEQEAVGRLRGRIGLLPAIVVSAIVPCPGTAMILLFAVSLGVVSLGLFATLMFSIGMAVTLTTVCVTAVLTKRVVTGAFDGPLGEALHLGVEGVGGLVMVAFGAMTLLPLL